MQKKNGFTLIELLVVIAIIAVLLGILMPALSKVRQQAYTIRCRANLKNYGTGLRMYLDDNDSCFPHTSSWMKSATSSYIKKGEVPTGQFWPYVKAKDCHLCPRFNQLNKNTEYADTQVSYVLNSYLGNSGAIFANWLGSGVTGVLKETEVYRTSEVVTFTEENSWVIEDYCEYPFNDVHFTMGNSSRVIDNFATFHNTSSNINTGLANLVFADGHVDDYKARSGIESEREKELERGFRMAWPKKNLPY